MKRIKSLLKQLQFNWAYLQEPAWDSGTPPPELVEYLDQHETGRALDLGCGTGTNVLYMARRGWRVDGIDFSWLAILQARRRIKHAQVTASLVKGDVTRLQDYDLRAPFDFALDIGCLHALGSLKAARAYVSGLAPLIRAGGEYRLYAHERKGANEAYPEHGLTLEWAERLFADSFELVEYRPGTERSFRSAWYYYRKKG